MNQANNRQEARAAIVIAILAATLVTLWTEACADFYRGSIIVKILLPLALGAFVYGVTKTPFGKEGKPRVILSVLGPAIWVGGTVYLVTGLDLYILAFMPIVLVAAMTFLYWEWLVKAFWAAGLYYKAVRCRM